MREYIIPAVVFRTEKYLPLDQVKALMLSIKEGCNGWIGDGEYKAVLNFVVDDKTRMSVEVGPTVPYDPDRMDEVLINISHLSSVRRYREYDMHGNREREKKAWRGFVKPKPKPDPALFPYGWDITKVAAGLQHMHEPEAREEAGRFAELLKGYPFTDRSPLENKAFIETEVIAILDDQFPHIKAVDLYLNGAVVRELRVIADPDNQPRLGESVMYFRCQFTNHPSTFASLSRSASDHLAAEKRKAAGAVAPKIKSTGITARYSELMIDQEMDYISAISAKTGDAVHHDDLSDDAKDQLKRKQTVNLY